MENSTTDDVYNYIKVYIADNQIAPSYHEISKGCFIGKSSVEKHLMKLESENRIQRIPRVPRSIRLIEEDNDDE